MTRIKIDPATVSQLPETYRRTIPKDYLDSMGHMNVMWYTHLFSMSFMGLMELMGMTDALDGRHDGGTFALESHIRYLSEVHAGHTVRIHSRIIGRSEKRFHVLHFMINEEKQDVSATQEIVSSYVSLSQRRTAPIPPEMAKPMDKLLAQSSQLTWEAPVCGIISA
ncbi:MAG: thioesterase family protein [Fuerstiella sp.]|nr:thioesterase family protein [Fuerstiella sp.]